MCGLALRLLGCHGLSLAATWFFPSKTLILGVREDLLGLMIVSQYLPHLVVKAHCEPKVSQVTVASVLAT